VAERWALTGPVDVDAYILDDEPANVQPPVHGRQHQRAIPDAAFVLHDGRHLYARARPYTHISTIKSKKETLRRGLRESANGGTDAATYL
jgi:hypothetical protein